MSPDGNQLPGLAWPAPDTGPVPPPEYQGRPRDDDRRTRKPMSLWDRSKFLVALAVVFVVLFWSSIADNPIIPVADAFNETLRTKWWLLALMGVELVRQIHYLICEHSEGYYRFWGEKVFGGVERRTHRINDWNRYRMGRALKFLFVLGVIAIVMGAATGTSPVIALFELPKSIWAALPMILQLVLFMLLAVSQFIAIFWFLSKGGMEVYFPDDIKTRFSDVWGQDAVVDRVKENILFLEDPERIEAKGGYVPGGILLWGPPGTGKTLMAEAVAGETGKPYVFVDPGAFTNMFIGVGILKVKSLFRKLRKLAVRYGGVIVFFDEADALGSRGQLSPQGAGAAFRGAGNPFTSPSCNGLSYLSPDTTSQLFHLELDASTEAAPPRRFVNRFIVGAGMGGGAGMGTLQALLTELSGLKKPRGFMNRVVRRTLGMRPKPPPKYRILVMMATNMPEALDEALLRPGRIDRMYKVGYPHKAGRVKTYEGYLAKVRHNLTPQQVDKLATITPYATGATIKDLVNEALIVAIRDGREEISWQDIIRAKQLKAMGPPEDAEYVERERHAVAVHEACHAVVAFRARRHATIDLATIERRGDVGGFVSAIPPEDRFTQWRSEYEADIMTAIASLAGERLFFDGDNSSGVSSDLMQATNVATLMEGYWGMGSTIASHEVTHKRGIGSGGRPGEKGKPGEADLLQGSLGERIEEKLAELFERTEEMLKENRLAVLAVAHALETFRTVTGDDVAAVIEGRQGPLVDGRAYRDPEFARLAEAYHAQVVAAHKGQGVLDIPLPVLNGNGHRPEYGSDVIVLPDSSVSGQSPWARPAPAPAPVDGGEGEGDGNGSGAVD